MDRHFANAPLEANLPLRLALLDIWQCDFLGLGSRCVAPYHHGLRRLPAYLQQLEMESNGKGVDTHGRALAFPSCDSGNVVAFGAAGEAVERALSELRERAQILKLASGLDLAPTITRLEQSGSVPGGVLHL